MSGLRQMNISFDPVEDRLLLRITAGEPGNLDEYRIWLTRRFVQIVWKVLDQAIASEPVTDPRVPQESAGALREFKQAAALAEADFATPFAAEEPGPLWVPTLCLSPRSRSGSSRAAIIC